MWFVLLSIALTVVAIGGLYFRRRVLAALTVFGVPRRYRRVVAWAIPWLLFGLPVLTFVYVGVSLALGRESFSMQAPAVVEWLIVYPFWMSVLVMLQAVPYLALFDVAGRVARRRVGADRVRRWTAVGTAVAIGGFAVYTPARILIDRNELHVAHYEVGPRTGAAPLRIAFLADLQLDRHTDTARATQVVSLVNEQKPDLILSGGDWINSGADHIDDAAAVAGTLRARLGVSSVRGDHEHFAYRDQHRSVGEVEKALARNNVDLVHNEVRWVEHAGKRVAIIYLSYNYIFRTPTREIEALVQRARSADYSILVTHQFDNKLAALVRDKVDLALIAHTHGGQVNPVVGLVHVNIARVETPYVAGRYQLGSTTLVVTSGIGYSIAPFRYASPASVEIIDLYL